VNEWTTFAQAAELDDETTASVAADIQRFRRT
jgi:hypothetical protein